MTKPVSADQLSDVANIELAERAHSLLLEGRHDLRQLDLDFIGALVVYLKTRTEVVVDKIVPAKQVLNEPAYVEGQHQAVIRGAVGDAKKLGVPDNFTDIVSSLFSGVLAISVEAQVQILGGSGIPQPFSQADLHRAE